MPQAVRVGYVYGVSTAAHLDVNRDAPARCRVPAGSGPRGREVTKRGWASWPDEFAPGRVGRPARPERSRSPHWCPFPSAPRTCSQHGRWQDADQASGAALRLDLGVDLIDTIARGRQDAVSFFTESPTHCSSGTEMTIRTSKQGASCCAGRGVKPAGVVLAEE